MHRKRPALWGVHTSHGQLEAVLLRLLGRMGRAADEEAAVVGRLEATVQRLGDGVDGGVGTGQLFDDARRRDALGDGLVVDEPLQARRWPAIAGYARRLEVLVDLERAALLLGVDFDFRATRWHCKQ